ncbi:MAG TPA: hypothetical protein VK789_12740 [Bryobacteraceae bacterium]|jgi:hypothetical protein|nr:hypothetical protein [Bryobacteraceae bacterium]
MNLSKLGALIVAVIFVPVACFGQSKEPCFGFLLKGDVISVCEGKTSQITHRGDIENFAVSDELSSLAYTTSRTTKRDATSSFVATTVTVANLKTGTSKQFQGLRTRGVVSSCGRILEIEVGSGGPTSTDVVTGEILSSAPYVFFRCSADRRFVAGVLPDPANSNKHGDLYFGVHPTTKIAAAEDVYPHFFNISPDGTKIAWFNDVRPLCIVSLPGQAQCVDHSTMSDPVSVNNSGEVLVATGTGQGCVYKTSSDFSPASNGGFGDDECLGIGYWKAGIKSIVIIKSIGGNPQWLSSATAGLLNKWSAQQPRSR